MNATNVTLDATKNINIDGAQNIQQTTSNTSSSSWALGASVDLSTKGVGYFGNFNSGKGSENGNIITNTGSIISASDTLKLKSGDDTNIIGSKVKGDKVVADIGGNLNIASKQDTDNYASKNQSVGLGFTAGSHTTGDRTGSFNTDKTDSNYASVTGQAGIFAGKGGFDINVGKNTDLKGAVIASTATPDKNKLSTDTLTYSDIQNKAGYNASSSSLSIEMKDGKVGLPKQTPGMPVSGNADSTTKSAVATGSIVVKGNPNQDLSGLSRDPSGTLNALDKIFDKKTVQEKQELANLFSQEGFKLVGDIALREYTKAAADASDAKKAGNTEAYDAAMKRKEAWGAGGTNEVLLHTLVGGLASSFSGNGFASGAVSSGTSEASRKLLKNLPPELQQLGSSIIGATASKLVGASGDTGSSIAVSGIVNNGLDHDQQEKLVNDLQYAVDHHSSAGIVTTMLKWSAVDQWNSTFSSGMGENGEDGTIRLMQSAANELGFKFTYEQGESVHYNINAFWGSMVSNAPAVDSSIVSNAGATVVVLGTTLYLVNGNWLKVASAASGGIQATKDIIAGYKGDVTHIINGSSSTTSGHAWEVFFDGVKPAFNEIEPYIANVIRNGTVTKTQNLPNGGTIVYKSLNINGFEVWAKEFIQNGVSRLSDAGVNNW